MMNGTIRKSWLVLSLGLISLVCMGCSNPTTAAELPSAAEAQVIGDNEKTDKNQTIKEKGELAEGNVDEVGVTPLNLGGMQKINIIEIKEQGSNVRAFRIEAKIQDKWQTVYTNDLIEAYHLAVLEEDITTNEIRLVIEDEVKPASIVDFSARYLESVKREETFTNTAYLSGNYFEHGWDYIHPDNFKSVTDIIMIGNFSFDNTGEYVLVGHDSTGLEKTLYTWDSEFATTNFPKWKESVTKYTTSDIWISITCHKQGPTGVPNGATDVFHDKAVRTQFLNDLVAFAKLYDITGYDIDWEYPNTAKQWQDYNNLILEASKLFKENGLKLSSAQAMGTGLSLESLKALDRINIMAYDNYGTTNNHSTFYNSAVRIIDNFKSKGIDPQKLILGVPYYGVKVDSYFEQWDYKHIYDQMIEANEFDPGKNLHGGWGFNGPNVIRDKVVYALEKGIGGVFCWQMKNDIPDFSSTDSLAGTASRTIERFVK